MPIYEMLIKNLILLSIKMFFEIQVKKNIALPLKVKWLFLIPRIILHYYAEAKILVTLPSI